MRRLHDGARGAFLSGDGLRRRIDPRPWWRRGLRTPGWLRNLVPIRADRDSQCDGRGLMARHGAFDGFARHRSGRGRGRFGLVPDHRHGVEEIGRRVVCMAGIGRLGGFFLVHVILVDAHPLLAGR